MTEPSTVRQRRVPKEKPPPSPTGLPDNSNNNKYVKTNSSDTTESIQTNPSNDTTTINNNMMVGWYGVLMSVAVVLLSSATLPTLQQPEGLLDQLEKAPPEPSLSVVSMSDIPVVAWPLEPLLTEDEEPDYAGIVDPDEEFGGAREIWFDEAAIYQHQREQRLERRKRREEWHARQYYQYHHHGHVDEEDGFDEEWEDDDDDDDDFEIPHGQHPDDIFALYHSHYDVKRVFVPPTRETTNNHEEDTCRPVSWAENHNGVHPTCNVMHEFDFASSYGDGQARYLGGGFFRRAFMAQENHSVDPLHKVVFKATAINPGRPLDRSAWDSCETEAVVNAALSPHPRIVDLYGYCGLVMMSEAMEKGDLYSTVAPNYERCKPHMPADPWELRNTLTGHEKVRLALEMAQAVATLHAFPGGTIVHNDLQVAQFLRANDDGNAIKLTDFNRATVLQRSEQNPDQPCSYTYFKTPGSSPEEYVVGGPLDEKIDIYNLASNFYVILTGVEPYFDTCEDFDIMKLVKGAKVPEIDNRWRKKSHLEDQLANLLLDMWAFNPTERPNIHQVVDRLLAILSTHSS